MEKSYNKVVTKRGQNVIKQICIMIKPASSLCNMRCKYCFYADVSNLRQIHSFGVMQPATTQKMLENIYCDLQPGDHITFAFQGGEPTLAGLDYFRNFVSQAAKQDRRVQVSYALQTNAILLDEAWCSFLEENHFLVGISLDMAAVYHDANRVDAQGKGTYNRVIAAKRMLERYRVDYNVLAVLTSELARHPTQVWNYLLKEQIHYVQFIPCLDDLQESGAPYALTPKRFAEFYKGLFPLWKRAYENGTYISIKLFDDIMNLLASGQSTACGMTGECQHQFIVEADGGVYPCDFYVLDEYKLGNLTENTLRELYESRTAADFIGRPHRKPQLCADCRFEPICHGGCKRQQSAVCCQGKDSYCGYRDFLEAVWPSLAQLANRMR